MTTNDDPAPREPESPQEAPLPVAAARIAVLKASYRQSWLYFLLAVCMIVAWWFPAQNAVHRLLAYSHRDTGPRDAMEFITLAYEGISENSSEVSPRQFKEQIAAMHKAGFMPISLRDVQALLKDGKPLPRRAVLLTFDQSRKSSYFEARSVLQRAGWNAVMFLWTQPIQAGEPASLRWPYIRRMLRGGAWELGAESHDGFSTVLADPTGKRGNFMTTPKWIGKERRYETPEEFMKRVAQDHETTRRILKQETGQDPVAFAFPYGDFGQYDERAVLTRRFNLDYVERSYALGFILGNSCVNTRQSDPRRLNRMLVRPEWTATDLVRRLEAALPRPEGFASAETLTDPYRWLVDWGDFSLRKDHALLAAATNTTGAKIWLNGSSDVLDFQARLRFRPDLGQLGLFLRASPDGESHVYLGLENDGRVWLRQKYAGMPPFTLASGRFTPDSFGEVNLSLFVRNNLLYATANDHPVFDEIPKMRGEPTAGMFGMSIWSPTPGVGRVTVNEFSLQPIFPTSLSWVARFARGPELSFWLSQTAYRYTHLSPPWLRLGTRGPVEQVGWTPELMAACASVYRMKFMPEITVEETAAMDLISPDIVAARAATLKPDGVLLNLSEMKGPLALSRMTSWLQTLGHSLETNGVRMMVRFPSLFERSAALPAIVGVIPNLQLAVAGDSPLASKSEQTGTTEVVRADSAVLPVEDIDLSLYYELASRSVNEKTWSTEMRAEMLRQEGFTAFTAGEFDRALEIWQRWSELESYNEEPVSLMGDVYLRRGDLEQAKTYYTRSLAMNPGQVSLALRLARLQDSSGAPEAAQKTLNLYARIFPNNPEIVLAQAEWLVRHGRSEEAGVLINGVLAHYPNDLRALTMLHQLLPTPADRIRNMRALVALGSQPGMEENFAAAIRDHDLMALPESWILMGFLDRMAKTAPPERREAYSRLLPLDHEVAEDFRLGRLSDNWISSADYEPNTSGNLLVGTSPSQTEAFLRLIRSDAMLDGYVEATIEEVRGFFWLYARRTESNMVRFGFDQTGNMFLQVWRDGRVVANETRFWAKPDGPVTLRLEIRADGAIGLVDGRPFFAAPVTIPRDMGLGWWGLAPWAPQFGVAQVAVRRVGGGPLPVQFGILRSDDERRRGEDLLDLLKPYTHNLTALAPRWFAQELDGTLRKETTGDHMDLRIFCRYYRIRLLPMVRAAAPLTLNMDHLVRIAHEENVDGFTLQVSGIPPDEWFRKIEDKLIGSGIMLAVVALDEKGGQMLYREVAPGYGLFPGPRVTHTIPLQKIQESAAAETGTEGADPAMAPMAPPPKEDSALML